MVGTVGGIVVVVAADDSVAVVVVVVFQLDAQVLQQTNLQQQIKVNVELTLEQCWVTIKI